MRKLTALLFGMLLTACAAKPPIAPVAALHAVQDQRLRELMAEMHSLILSEKEMTDHQKDSQRREYNQKMAEAAEAMGRTVVYILASLPSLRINPAEQPTFQALADKLRSQSGELKELAAANRNDVIPAELERISLTCKACHTLFRSSGG